MSVDSMMRSSPANMASPQRASRIWQTSDWWSWGSWSWDSWGCAGGWESSKTATEKRLFEDEQGSTAAPSSISRADSSASVDTSASDVRAALERGATSPRELDMIEEEAMDFQRKAEAIIDGTQDADKAAGIAAQDTQSTLQVDSQVLDTMADDLAKSLAPKSASPPRARREVPEPPTPISLRSPRAMDPLVEELNEQMGFRRGKSTEGSGSTRGYRANRGG